MDQGIVDGVSSASTGFQPRRYAFVLPRFGEGIVGGAETLIGELARHLAMRGDNVEVLTTCARDNRTFADDYPSGKSTEFGVAVSRFPVDSRNLEVWIPNQIKISEGMNLPLDDQLAWMQEGVNSKALYAAIAERGPSFDALFFGPYLFGTTFWGSLIHPDRSFLIPCLHDEHYAYTDVVRSMFRLVRGALFNTTTEQEVALRLYGKVPGGEVGMGFYPYEIEQSLKPYFKEKFPYVLCIGRKETGKNVQLLIDYFIHAKELELISEDLHLVIAGGGSFSDLHRPHALERGDIIDLQQLSEIEKLGLIKHAQLLCQPSTNESFSIVIMEAWLLGVPVLVHADCSVTRQHVVDSGGGLYFCNETELAVTVKHLTEDTALRLKLAQAGKLYVEKKYNWDSVIDRFDRVMQPFLV